MRPASVPSPATLGLTRPTAAEDLARLGWDNADSLDLLWTLAAAGDPDLALNTLMRVFDGAPEIGPALREDETFRVRLIALLGGSSAFGDHLAANPGTGKNCSGRCLLPRKCCIRCSLRLAQSRQRLLSNRIVPILPARISPRRVRTARKRGSTKHSSRRSTAR